MEPKTQRNTALLSDRQKGMTYRKLGEKYNLARNTIIEILARTEKKKLDTYWKCSKCGMVGNTSGVHPCKGKKRMADIKGR